MTALHILIERSRSGDLDAFGEVVRRFQDMAHGYAYSILGDFHLAEDAAQEAFIDAYYKLHALREPAAFPGWFRRIVFKHCDRVTRKKRLATVPLEEGTHVPEQRHERNELRESVLEAVRGLSEPQREATTLYYIDGYSQPEIAEFLEVPVTTVQKRLHDSRKKLKERVLQMVENTLKGNAPDERFSQHVVEELRSHPDFLKLEGHPVKQAVDAVLDVLPEYEWVEGDEIIEKDDPTGVYSVDVSGPAYHLDTGRVLRTSTTPIVLRALAGRSMPVRLIAAGRAFRSGSVKGDPIRANVFHMVEAVCVASTTMLEDMESAMEKVMLAILPATKTTYKRLAKPFPGFADNTVVSVRYRGAEVQVADMGMLGSELLGNAGFDPAAVSGFAFGLGLDRLAMVKLGLHSIHALWKPPYLRYEPR